MEVALDNWAGVEADFRHYYHIRLLDVWTTISFREFSSYLTTLPEESRLANAMRNTPYEAVTDAEVDAVLSDM